MQSEEYITFALGRSAGVPHSQDVDVKNMETKEAGNYFITDSNWVGKPDKIVLTLKGKFHILNGGYQGETKKRNEEKNRIKKQDEQIRLLTLLLAIGSIGVLIVEALKFLLDYFL